MSAYQIFEQKSKEYDDWYQRNPFIYQSELSLFRELITAADNSLEIGIGTGRFAGPLGITNGIDPSAKMLAICRQNYPDIKTLQASAENSPFADKSFDLILVTTSICYLDDLVSSFQEFCRILKDDGQLVLGFVNKDSFLGKHYQQKAQQPGSFYEQARFRSYEDLENLLTRFNFVIQDIKQTIFTLPQELKEIHATIPGKDKGGFIGIKARKGE